jgi:uncharacterized membrane protein YkoI
MGATEEVDMSRKVKVALVAACALALLAVVGGVGFAAVGDDDQPLTGSRLERATTAALASTGGGEVVGSELGDDEGVAYEVEVRLADGSRLEVMVDADFVVIGSEPDDDGTADEDEGDEDD